MLLFLIASSTCGAVGFIAHQLRKAPEGWEDGAGFHFRETVRTAAVQHHSKSRPNLIAVSALSR